MIVVDASAVLEVLLGTAAADAAGARMFAPGETLHAPYLIDIEIVQVLRRYAMAGAIDATRGAQGIADFRDLRLRRYPHELLLDRIWELRANLTAYDAAYVALAEALDAPLLTGDRRLAGAPGHRARIAVL